MKLNDKINEEQGYISELNDEIGNLCKILKEKEHNLALIKEDTYITYAELTYEKSLLNRIEQSNLIIKQEAIFRSVLTLVFAIIVSLHPVAIVAIITTALFGLYQAIKLINCIKEENEIARNYGNENYKQKIQNHTRYYDNLLKLQEKLASDIEKLKENINNKRSEKNLHEEYLQKLIDILNTFKQEVIENHIDQLIDDGEIGEPEIPEQPLKLIKTKSQ